MKKFWNAAVMVVELAQPVQAADLNVLIDSISEPGGTLYWSVFDNKDDYKADLNPVIAAKSRVSGSELRITLHDLPSGEYAIRLFHDANDNGELDTNMLGIPREGYGFSNNAGQFGPATFEDAKVAVEGDQQINISVR